MKANWVFAFEILSWQEIICMHTNIFDVNMSLYLRIVKIYLFGYF